MKRKRLKKEEIDKTNSLEVILISFSCIYMMISVILPVSSSHLIRIFLYGFMLCASIFVSIETIQKYKSGKKEKIFLLLEISIPLICQFYCSCNWISPSYEWLPLSILVISVISMALISVWLISIVNKENTRNKGVYKLYLAFFLSNLINISFSFIQASNFKFKICTSIITFATFLLYIFFLFIKYKNIASDILEGNKIIFIFLILLVSLPFHTNFICSILIDACIISIFLLLCNIFLSFFKKYCFKLTKINIKDIATEFIYIMNLVLFVYWLFPKAHAPIAPLGLFFGIKVLNKLLEKRNTFLVLIVFIANVCAILIVLYYICISYPTAYEFFKFYKSLITKATF